MDEEEEVYDFVDDGIIRSSEVSSAIFCHTTGHHFPGKVKSTANCFEISRIMCILERCINMGFRKGIESYRTEITTMLGSGAKPFTDHEIAIGNPNGSLGILSQSDGEPFRSRVIARVPSDTPATHRGPH